MWVPERAALMERRLKDFTGIVCTKK